MSEGIDYAEMLEIPVTTVNVVQKKRRRARDLKHRAVGKVNERMEARAQAADATYAGNEPPETVTPFDDDIAESSLPEEPEIEGIQSKAVRTHPVLIAEFALACVLCAVIFLTNVFMSDSAINTFLRSVLSGNGVGIGAAGDETVVKTYSDFKLTPVVSEYADVTTTLSDTGVLSFQSDCSVYPACDAKVSSITKSGDTYTVALSHSETFQSVYTGLSEVYYKEGENVLSNVPFAYSDGNAAVQVSFYQDGQMLNCYSVDAENCLSWNL